MSSSLQEKLLKSSNEEIYDPFESPPNLEKAENHRRAISVGVDLDQDEQSKICPCCENIIEKQPIPLNCADEDLLFLGLGYPLFYKLTRYFAMIIGLIFLISGSGFYLLVTLNCQNDCIYFIGIPIINLEISGEQTAQITDIVNVITAFAIFLGVMNIKSRINEDICQLEEKIISPEQYTLILQNLPEDINEDELTEWIKESFDVKPILINFAYNISELSESYARRQELTISLNKKVIKRNQLESEQSLKKKLDGQIKEINQQITNCDKIIENYKQQTVSCRKIGTAFVTFSEVHLTDQILQKYESSFLNSFLSNLFSVIRRPPLTFRGKTIVVARAPAPREVIWENLSFSFLKSFVAELFFVLTMILLIFVAFKVQFKIVSFAYELRKASERSKETIIVFEALLMALIVVIVNSLIRLVIKLFAYLKRYSSYSNYHASFCFYYSLMYTLNTCFMIYIVHSHKQFKTTETEGTVQQDHVLIYDIHLIMLANAFSQPLFKIFEPIMWTRIFWKKYVEGLKKEKNPYTQSYANKLWEGYEISNSDNYQYIFRVLVVTTWFAHCAPFGVIFSFLGLLLDYWINKFLLLRYYKRPENISKKIALPMINTLELLPLVYICGILQFTYKVSDSLNLFTFLTKFLQYGITTSVLFICILGYLLFSKPKKINSSPIRYDEIEIMFPYNYETENPITKLKGEIKYLYGVLRKGGNTSDSKIIRQILNMSNKRKSRDELLEQQSEIVKMKKKNLKRLTTMERSIELDFIDRTKKKDTKNYEKSDSNDSDY